MTKVTGQSIPALIALDVDGTLADPSGEVRAVTREAVALARQAGSKIALATGRSWPVAEPIADILGGIDHAVCSNGAYVIEPRTGMVSRDLSLGKQHPRSIVNTLRDNIPGIGLGVAWSFGAKAEAGWRGRLPPDVKVGRPVDDVLTLLEQDRGPVVALVAFHDDYDEDLDGLIELISPLLNERASARHSGMRFIQIGPIGMNKATALAELCVSLDIDPADTMAFGDDHNDIEMLSWAGRGYAMSNGPAAVRAAANHIAPSNAEDGVARILFDHFAQI